MEICLVRKLITILPKISHRVSVVHSLNSFNRNYVTQTEFDEVSTGVKVDFKQNQKLFFKECSNAKLEVQTDMKLNFKTNRKSFLKEYSNAEPILETCAKLQLKEILIMEAIRRKPEILDFNPTKFPSSVSTLIDFGFSTDEISRMILKYPHLLEYESEDIASTLEVWIKCQLVHNYVREVLLKYPLLFSISNDETKRRLSRIFYLMQNRINRVMSLLKKNPSIMYINWDDVEERFRYLYKTMRVTEKNISMSKALSKPLSHIMIRHTFLERCGVYVKPSLKEKKGLLVHENPHLHEIVDYDEETFAKITAKLSLDEFTVFKDLMKYEDEDNADIIEGDFDQ